MSLPDKALFDRYCQLNIGGRLFAGPPFSIEFEQKMKIGVLTATKVKLYNPNQETIQTAQPKGSGKVKDFAECVIDAGFLNDWGTTALGQINDFKVIKKAPDVILEMSVSDITQKWANSFVGQSWKDTNASVILQEIIDDAGITTEINVGTDVKLRTFTARTLRGAIKKLTKVTESQYYFKNGILKIEPKELEGEREVLYISPGSGLLDKIEKIKDGFKFKTLFFYKLQMGDVIKIEDKNTDPAIVKLVEGKKKFSTFRSAYCEFEAKEL